MSSRAEQELRIGDAERERAASQLADHYAQGRLDQAEHSERLDRIWAAKTRAELDPVFLDLPGHAPAAPAAPRSAADRLRSARRGGPRLPAPLLVLLVVLGVVTVFTHLPIILVGLGAWFLLSRGGGCGGGRSRQWAHGGNRW